MSSSDDDGNKVGKDTVTYVTEPQKMWEMICPPNGNFLVTSQILRFPVDPVNAVPEGQKCKKRKNTPIGPDPGLTVNVFYSKKDGQEFSLAHNVPFPSVFKSPALVMALERLLNLSDLSHLQYLCMKYPTASREFVQAFNIHPPSDGTCEPQRPLKLTVLETDLEDLDIAGETNLSSMITMGVFTNPIQKMMTYSPNAMDIDDNFMERKHHYLNEQHSNVSWGTLMVLFALFRVDLLAGLTESYLSLHDGFYAKPQEYMAFLTTFATMSKIIESINPNLHVLRKLLKSNLKLGVSMFAQNGIYKRILRNRLDSFPGHLQPDRESDYITRLTIKKTETSEPTWMHLVPDPYANTAGIDDFDPLFQRPALQVDDEVCIFHILGFVFSQLCERRDNEHVIFFLTDAASKIHRVSPDVLTDGEKCARIKAILEGIFMSEDFRVAAYAKAIILLLAKAYDIDPTTIEPKIVTEVNNNTGQHRLSLPAVFQATPGVDTTLFMHGVPIVAKMGEDNKTLTLTFAADQYYGAEKVTEDLKKIHVDFRFAVVSGVPCKENMETVHDMGGIGEVVKSILGDLNPKSVKPQRAIGGRLIVHFPDVVEQVVLMMHVQTTRQQPYRHNAVGLYLGLCEFKIHGWRLQHVPLAIKGESPSRQEKGPGGLRKELYNMFVVDIGNVIKLLQESPTAKKMYTSLVENSSAKTREYLRKVIDELAKY